MVIILVVFMLEQVLLVAADLRSVTVATYFGVDVELFII